MSKNEGRSPTQPICTGPDRQFGLWDHTTTIRERLSDVPWILGPAIIGTVLAWLAAPHCIKLMYWLAAHIRF